jgi:hypothetical protein
MAVGVDIAKQVFRVHYFDQESGEIVNKPIKRTRFLEHFPNRAPCLIGMEACGGALHWARQLTKMGHEVRLMPAEFVKASNIRNKNDAADARAIWLAVQQPGKPVAVKTEMQQAMPALPLFRCLPDATGEQLSPPHGLEEPYCALMASPNGGLLDVPPRQLPNLTTFLEECKNALAELDCIVVIVSPHRQAQSSAITLLDAIVPASIDPGQCHVLFVDCPRNTPPESAFSGLFSSLHDRELEG